MRAPKKIPNELKRLINTILERCGDCETWLNGYIEIHGDSLGMAPG